MLEAVFSPLLEKFRAITVDGISYNYNLVKDVKKELLDLPDMLLKVREGLDDAEYQGLKNQRVKRWLEKLEKMAYEMDDILDEWKYYSLLKQKAEASAVPQNAEAAEASAASWLRFPTLNTLGNFIQYPSSCYNEVSIRRDIAKKIQNVKSTLDQLLKDKDDFNFEASSQRRTDHLQNQSTSSIDVKKVFGSDIYKKRDDIVRNMMHNTGGIQILSIVGTGGLGKTTLAQLIFNNDQFKTDWLKIWVCVSNPFVAAVVAKDIVIGVGKETIPQNANQLDFALQKLRASVSGKKFLLVLDDVWTEDRSKWAPLKINLDHGAPGSKILVTTRNERVAELMGTLSSDIYRPEKLSDDECWSILRDTSSLAQKSEEECKKFEEVGKKIAKKCEGLPLAAVVLGTLLYFKDLDGWNQVEKSEIWELENARLELFPHLVLSYNDLSPDLKRCFSYCAVYPKDHKIHAETLIEEWMAQSYLGSDSGNGALELKGRENLRNLAMRCLFQDIEQSESGEQIEWCKMHDIVHDFALFLRKNDDNERSCQVCEPSLVSHVQEYRSLSWYTEESGQVCNCMKSVRVLRIERFNSPIPVGIEALIHLRWLDISWTNMSKDGLEIICRLYFLQTLLLSHCSLTEIPIEIGNLVQLRRLDLGRNKELKQLPESIGNLVELRTLSLECCSIEEIPREIGNLVQLRRLDLSENEELRQLPESICSLVELQILLIEGTSINRLPEALGELSNLYPLELDSFKVGSEYNKLSLLKKLHRHLSGSLSLGIYCSSMSEMVELVENARAAQLKTHLQKLKTLEISFMDAMNETEQSSVSSMWMEVVDALVPHYTLKKLKISGYKGSRLPQCMSSPFSSIKQIFLTAMNEVSSLPAIGKLPFLEILDIWHAGQLMFVGREFLGIESSYDNVVVAFPKLQLLSFYFCNEWEGWEDITEEEEESAAISIMPCLIYLSIESCTSLKKLPHRLLHKVSSSLRLLDISYSSELIKTYREDNEGSAWRSISQDNPQLRLFNF